MALLEKMGHDMTRATNGAEAAAKWTAGSFDLAFMDVQMPEVDGFDATARIRALERAGSGHVPILATTARAVSGDRERCLEAAWMSTYPSP